MLGLYGVAAPCCASYVRYRQSITREYLAGENMRQLDVRTTELFLEKSLGMHISENNHLNEANVKKGYDRVLGLEGMLLFEGIEALLNIVLPFIALCGFSRSPPVDGRSAPSSC